MRLERRAPARRRSQGRSPASRTRVADDHRQDVARFGAEREPDADFRGPLADGVRHHAVDADRRQHQRQRRERRQQHRAEARLRRASAPPTDPSSARRRPADPCRCARTSRSMSGANDAGSDAVRTRQRHRAVGELRVRPVGRRAAPRWRRSAYFDVADDADDFSRHVRIGHVDDQALAERIAVREVALRQRLVDDDDVRLLVHLAVGEEASASPAASAASGSSRCRATLHVGRPAPARRRAAAGRRS